MPRILVLGSGFAGLWAAVGGARKLAELGIPRGQVEILVVERNPYHGIRVRNYEPDPATSPFRWLRCSIRSASNTSLPRLRRSTLPGSRSSSPPRRYRRTNYRVGRLAL